MEPAPQVRCTRIKAGTELPDAHPAEAAFPAINERSSTRREELLLGPDITQRVWLMRRMYSQMVTDPPNGAGMTFGQATEAILEEMKRTENNMEFLETLNK